MVKVRWWKKPKNWQAELLNLTADCKDLLISIKRILEDWETSRLNSSLQHITAGPTPTAPTKDNQWGVQGQDSISQEILRSLQLAPAGTQSGPVVQGCKCAIPSPRCGFTRIADDKLRINYIYCHSCGVVLLRYGRTLAPDVGTGRLTSVKPVLRGSAGR